MKLRSFFLKTFPNKIGILLNGIGNAVKNFMITLWEFFWPILEKQGQAVAPVNSVNLVVIDENLDLALHLQTKVLENEEDRRKGLEQKAALFISTISVASSIVLAASTLVINTKKADGSVVIKLSVILSFILTVYALRTVWFAVKALTRGKYEVLDINDINVNKSKEEYKKHLINRFIEIEKSNQQIINAKVDNVTMAQEYYKRAIVTISLYAFVILLFSILK